MEIWKDIEGYEGLYQVSNEGRVRSLINSIVLKNNIKENGYLRVVLRKNGKSKYLYVHRLVAQAFIDNPNNLPFVNHKDENPSNNVVENLEWCDVKYNNTYGTVIERKSKKIDQLTLDGELVKVWNSSNECGRNGFTQALVTKCCLGQRNTHKGFIWKYHNI